jgi:PAP2 superfamily
MKSRPACAVLAAMCFLGTARLSADVITDWNNVMLEAIRVGALGPEQTRVMAMTHTAIFDAVNSIDDTHQPYHVNLNVPSTTSREAAAAQAAHDVLVSVFPAQQATLATALGNSLSGIPAGPAKTDGIALGSSVAGSIIALRANDHSGDTTPYTPGTLPGQWRPTPPGFAPANLPNWPTVTPWTMPSGSHFRDPVGPPALSSAAYAAELNEVKAIGAVNSATRTPDETNSARVWAGGQGPIGHWNQIARTVAAAEGNTLSENARLFALLNLAEADAPIVSWDNKYHWNFWRPVTAIQLADQDGNAATEADPNWLPLLTTPPYPSHTSGASTVSGAAGEILERFFETDNISFTMTVPGVGDRSFTSFSQASEEAALSRMWGGIHFRFEDDLGLAHGIALGELVFKNELRPIPEPGTWLLLIASLLAAMLIPARRSALNRQEK